jgi:hypothetical protein
MEAREARLIEEAKAGQLSRAEKAWVKKAVKVLEGATKQHARMKQLIASAPASMEPERRNLRHEDTPGHTAYWEADHESAGGFERLARLVHLLKQRL